MGLLEPSVGIDRRLSSCTLCHEAEERAALPAAAKSETIVGREERFDGDVTQGTFEPWRVGRSLGDGAFAQVKLVQGLKSGRIVGIWREPGVRLI